MAIAVLKRVNAVFNFLSSNKRWIFTGRSRGCSLKSLRREILIVLEHILRVPLVTLKYYANICQD